MLTRRLLAVLSTVLLTWLVGLWGCARVPPDEVVHLNLGDLSGKDQVEAVVTVRNPTSSPRIIRLVEKDCSCLGAEFSDKVVPPMGEVTGKFRYRVPARTGHLVHLVRLHYHQTTQSTMIVLTGTVNAWLDDLQPKEILFEGCAGEAYEKTLQVRVRERWPLSQQEVELTLPYAGWTVASVDSEHRSYQFTIVFFPSDDLEPRSLDGRFVVQWRNRPDRKIDIPCRAQVYYPWKSEPESLFLGVVKRGMAMQTEVQLSPRCARFADVTLADIDVQSNHPFLSARAVAGESNGIRLTVTFAASTEVENVFISSKLVIYDKRNGQLFAVIPVQGYVEG